MIQAKDLKIGITLNINGDACTIGYATLPDIALKLKGIKNPYLNSIVVEPIPLNDTNLKNLGFEFQEPDFMFHKYGIGLRKLGEGYVYLNGCDGGLIMKYVHQIQLLIHSLTGEELIYNPQRK